MDFVHRVRVRELQGYADGIELQQILERQFDVLKKPWNENWCFSTDELCALPLEVMFTSRAEAMQFADTLSELYGIVVKEPFYAASPAPVDAVWTHSMANALICELEARLSNAGFARPNTSADETLNPLECGDHEHVWFMNIELNPDETGVRRVVEFYVDEADFPFEESHNPKIAPATGG